MPPIPLELLAYDLVVGAHPASERSNLKKGVNTNDGNKIKLCILLCTHFILFVRVALLTGRVADGLANIISTVMIPGFLPQPLYKK